MKRGIAAVVGSRIRAVTRPRSGLRPIQIVPEWGRFRRRLQGRRIESVGRVGKRVVLFLAGGRAPQERLVIEPRMTGLVLLADPPDREHLRLVFELAGSGPRRLLFWDRRGLGSVRLLGRLQFERRYGEEKIGPDALLMTPELLQARLGSSRRAVKVALLDQRAVAGIGNLYASEILHLAGIHPERRCHQLRSGEWQALCAAILEVLRAAIRFEGSTLSDGTYRNALNQAGGYQSQHRVYARSGEACLACGSGRVLRVVQAQRSTYYCGVCQPRRKGSTPTGRPSDMIARDAAGNPQTCTAGSKKIARARRVEFNECR